MIVKHLQTGIEVSDEDFDVMYSKGMRDVSEIHFTPVEVAKSVAAFLVDKAGTKVLDIGSGAGKFCMVGAACTHGFFTGVEQREGLFDLSEQLSKYYALQNTAFIHSNITDIDFRDFDAIYFYNSFFENIASQSPIDNSILLDRLLYIEYAHYMREQLDLMPIGTRLATYFCYLVEVPDSYKIQATEFDGKLKLWVKMH